MLSETNHALAREIDLGYVKTVCEHIFKEFRTLNKPTKCRMVFKLPTINIIDFQLTDTFPDGTQMGISPCDVNWIGTPLNDLIHIEKIKGQTNQKFSFERECLIRVIDPIARKNEFDYLCTILIHRINFTSMESFKSGTCGELVSYAAMLFVFNNQNFLSQNHTLEVFQLTSSYADKNGSPYTHVIGVIDRDLLSNINDPQSWGQRAVIFDPWNQGDFFKAISIMNNSYYAYGKWEYKLLFSFKRPSLDNDSDESFLKDFQYLEQYILNTSLPAAKMVEYINDAIQTIPSKKEKLKF